MRVAILQKLTARLFSRQNFIRALERIINMKTSGYENAKFSLHLRAFVLLSNQPLFSSKYPRETR